MKRLNGIARIFTAAALALLFFSCNRPPNLILIITDDQGYGDLSLHGNTILETPNLDAIGLNGTRLDNFHVSPVCAPTRAAVLTGRRPLSTGTYWVTRGGEVMNAEEYTMAEVLKDNGFSTGCFGKWHNGAHHPNHPLSQGFDEFFGFTAGHWNCYFDPELEHNGKMVKTEGYIADLFTDQAIDFIRRKKEGPFFCYLAYNTPHSPFQVPDAYFDMYIDKVEDHDSALRIMNASVYGMVRNIDDNVGRLMGTVRDLGLEENTIVVFLSDNGPNTVRYNGHMKGRKGWVNDGGVRVPCFIQWKGHVPGDRVVSSMTAHIDLLPTLANMMEVKFEPRNEIHGIDLTPRILGVDREEERCLFTHVNQGSEIDPLPGAIRSVDWRLVVTRPGLPELTRRSDAREQINLADSLPELSDSLFTLYQDWFGPFMNHRIPPVPVGVTDAVTLPAHEGFLEGSARYFWSDNGWSNDWVTSLNGEGARIYWPIKVQGPGRYLCSVTYASPDGNARIYAVINGTEIGCTVPPYIPVPDRNFNRIDRTGEAIGQTWAGGILGEVTLEEGPGEVALWASSQTIQVLSVTLTLQR
jgi:arylsulfatase A-like enzyme